MGDRKPSRPLVPLHSGLPNQTWICGECDTEVSEAMTCPDCFTVLCHGCASGEHAIPAGDRAGMPCMHGVLPRLEPVQVAQREVLAAEVPAAKNLAGFSAAAKAARKPLPPEYLADAQHNRVHRDRGRARAACTVRSKRGGSVHWGPNRLI